MDLSRFDQFVSDLQRARDQLRKYRVQRVAAVPVRDTLDSDTSNLQAAIDGFHRVGEYANQLFGTDSLQKGGISQRSGVVADADGRNGRPAADCSVPRMGVYDLMDALQREFEDARMLLLRAMGGDRDDD